MKKQTIKNLAFKKSTISTFEAIETLKGGGRNTSHTSCLCMDTMCECDPEKTFL
ncbi:hypothetical protein [Kordia sp.]|uniref:hypothetical protein n=1 Tax=Kordia sp. TaxID=1965332 RepID=UPI0025B8BC3B|nr:hypothetical protein [Kordia sp.]MCH2194686.1 hypothetical protein [Kordia sp.]